MKTLVLASLASLLALTACPPSPAPVPPDASDAAPPSGTCASWCASWKERGCREGLAANCLQVCQHIVDSRLTKVNPDVCTK